jgi:ABC-type branched-subunit amino acid transport system permease subunit
VGPLVLTLIPEVSRVLKEYQPFVFVAVLYGVVFFLPGGLAYLLERMSIRIGAILQRGIKANA